MVSRLFCLCKFRGVVHEQLSLIFTPHVALLLLHLPPHLWHLGAWLTFYFANHSYDEILFICTAQRCVRCTGSLFLYGITSYIFSCAKFDGGGFRWPFIFDMCLSGLIVGEILLTVQMALKQAVGPTAAAALTLVPTLLFRTGTKKRFLHSFEDAALLQTSLLDGWDTAAEYSIEKREEFRRFLVDAHKAAYVSNRPFENLIMLLLMHPNPCEFCRFLRRFRSA